VPHTKLGVSTGFGKQVIQGFEFLWRWQRPNVGGLFFAMQGAD
jgi:hypothetical protein